MIPQTTSWILGAGARDAIAYIRGCDSPAKLRTLRTHERRNAQRAGILKAIDIRLRKLASQPANRDADRTAGDTPASVGVAAPSSTPRGSGGTRSPGRGTGAATPTQETQP